MKKTVCIALSVLLILFLAVPSFASSTFFSPAPVLSRTLRFDLFSFLQWDMRMIRMPSIWDSGLTGHGVQIGIIDSGSGVNMRSGAGTSYDVVVGLADGTEVAVTGEKKEEANGYITYVGKTERGLVSILNLATVIGEKEQA